MADQVKETLERLNGAFEDFKQSNDERIKQIEAKGKADPLLEEKVDKANAAISSLQGELAEAKKSDTRIDDLEERLEERRRHRAGDGSDTDSARGGV